MKTISATFLGLFFMLMLSSTAFADSAVGKVIVPAVQASSGGGSSWRNVIIYNINITNGSVVATPEQISLPLVKPIINKTSAKQILFDIGMKINKKEVFVNEKLVSTISLINLGVPGKVNVTAIYRIIDSAGNTVYEESEIVTVETQLEFLKEFDISKLDEGTYSLLAEVKYEGQKEPARADDVFYVQKSFMQKFGIIILLVLAVILISLVVIWIIFKERVYLERMAKKVHVYFVP
jgi:hypothetical protein